MPSVASISVDIAGPPPETKYVELKSPRVKTVSSSVQTIYSKLAINGSVTCTNRRRPLAPSTAAALVKLLRDCHPSSQPVMIVQNGTVFQM